MLAIKKSGFRVWSDNVRFDLWQGKTIHISLTPKESESRQADETKPLMSPTQESDPNLHHDDRSATVVLGSPWHIDGERLIHTVRGIGYALRTK